VKLNLTEFLTVRVESLSAFEYLKFWTRLSEGIIAVCPEMLNVIVLMLFHEKHELGSVEEKD